MRVLVLFDNGTPRGVARGLLGHTVEEARDHGWDTLTNGELLKAAEAAGFDVLLTTDRNIRHQQNLTGRKIAVVVMSKARWRLIEGRLPQIAAAVAETTPGSFTEIEIPSAEWEQVDSRRPRNYYKLALHLDLTISSPQKGYLI